MWTLTPFSKQMIVFVIVVFSSFSLVLKEVRGPLLILLLACRRQSRLRGFFTSEVIGVCGGFWNFLRSEGPDSHFNYFLFHRVLVCCSLAFLPASFRHHGSQISTDTNNFEYIFVSQAGSVNKGCCILLLNG
jgi:hypothetical protein